MSNNNIPKDELFIETDWSTFHPDPLPHEFWLKCYWEEHDTSFIIHLMVKEAFPDRVTYVINPIYEEEDGHIRLTMEHESYIYIHVEKDQTVCSYEKGSGESVETVTAKSPYFGKCFWEASQWEKEFTYLPKTYVYVP